MCIVCIAVEREQLPSTRQTYDIDTPEYDMHNYAYSNSRSTSYVLVVVLLLATRLH